MFLTYDTLLRIIMTFISLFIIIVMIMVWLPLSNLTLVLFLLISILYYQFGWLSYLSRLYRDKCHHEIFFSLWYIIVSLILECQKYLLELMVCLYDVLNESWGSGRRVSDFELLFFGACILIHHVRIPSLVLMMKVFLVHRDLIG